MGALVSKSQVDEVRSQIDKLLKEASMVYGDPRKVELVGADADLGAFLSPMLLVNEKPLSSKLVHEVEAFGPVCTLMPYHSLDEAIEISKLGKGSLCSSIATYNNDIARQFVVGAASHHGRILVYNRDCAKENTGHGSPLPMLVHGGPGRAGGGEEMGGMRGVLHHMQRTAVQGSPRALSAITNRWVTGAPRREDAVHPFRKTLAELRLGDTVVAGPRE